MVWEDHEEHGGPPIKSWRDLIGPLLLMFAFMSIPTPAAAWGRLGHEVICEIAYAELSPAARARLDELFRLDDEFDRFPSSCSWADFPRKRPTEHYVNWSRSMSAGRVEGCGAAKKCVISAIEDDTEALADPRRSDREQLELVKFIGHWVGDVHQPMHTGFADDRGANLVKVSGLCSETLHAAWDTCLIEKGIGVDARLIAPLLCAEISGAERADWTASKSAHWANESRAIATAPAVGYCVEVAGECRYSETILELADPADMKTVVIDETYVSTHAPVIRKQLQRAGVRLAATLERALRARHETTTDRP